VSNWALDVVIPIRQLVPPRPAHRRPGPRRVGQLTTGAQGGEGICGAGYFCFRLGVDSSRPEVLENTPGMPATQQETWRKHGEHCGIRQLGKPRTAAKDDDWESRNDDDAEERDAPQECGPRNAAALRVTLHLSPEELLPKCDVHGATTPRRDT
jgi:hypothetical protein